MYYFTPTPFGLYGICLVRVGILCHESIHHIPSFFLNIEFVSKEFGKAMDLENCKKDLENSLKSP